MLSGLEVLGSFDELARQSAGESQAVDREVAGLTEQLVKLRERQAETYRALARLRVGDLTDDVLQRDLDAAERQARRLLEERATASQALEAKLGEAAADLADLAKRQAELAEEQERLAESAEAAEAEALKQLAETQTYKTQRARAEEAEKIARHAEEKTGFAKQDRLTKGQPYEDDPLFMYLWRRGFGTAAYEAGFLARYFDRRVARLISFEKARANYAMLLEIPKRLEAHAQRQRKIAEAEAQSLDDLEESAVESGTAQERRRHLAEARRRLADLEEKLAALAAKRADLLEQRGLLTRGDDRLTREALELIETALKRRDLRALREQALRTPLPDDDALVDRLRDLEAEASDIGKLLEARKAIQQEQQRRLRDLEGLRNEYRRRGYNKQPLDFGDLGMLSVLLGQVLNGALSRDGLWEQLERRRSVRVPGSLGGGTPRLPGGGPGWGRVGGGTRVGGRSRGGFRTGGSF